MEKLATDPDPCLNENSRFMASCPLTGWSNTLRVSVENSERELKTAEWLKTRKPASTQVQIWIKEGKKSHNHHRFPQNNFWIMCCFLQTPAHHSYFRQGERISSGWILLRCLMWTAAVEKHQMVCTFCWTSPVLMYGNSLETTMGHIGCSPKFCVFVCQ